MYFFYSQVFIHQRSYLYSQLLSFVNMERKIQSAKNLNMKDKWSLMIENIVRPPRKIYTQQQLGSAKFQIGSNIFKRQQHEVYHKEKPTKLTIYTTGHKNIVILYLHSNASNKLEANQLLNSLPTTFSLASFDFFGCGLDLMEQYVTLGIREAQQTASICQYLQSIGYKVVIWGRSMGAVTALLYGKAQMIIADSPFLTFKQVCKQISTKMSPCPLRPIITCLFPCIFSRLRKDIQKSASYDVNQLNSIKAVQKIDPKTKLILIIGNQDEIIQVPDIQQIYHAFKGDNKYMFIVNGKHNDDRPRQFLNKIMGIVQTKCEKQDKQEKNQKINEAGRKSIKSQPNLKHRQQIIPESMNRIKEPNIIFENLQTHAQTIQKEEEMSK